MRFASLPTPSGSQDDDLPIKRAGQAWKMASHPKRFFCATMRRWKLFCCWRKHFVLPETLKISRSESLGNVSTNGHFPKMNNLASVWQKNLNSKATLKTKQNKKHLLKLSSFSSSVLQTGQHILAPTQQIKLLTRTAVTQPSCKQTQKDRSTRRWEAVQPALQANPNFPAS